MNELVQHENLLPLLLMYIIIGIAISAKFYYAMLDNQENYRVYHLILAAVFNCILWPFKLVQMVGVYIYNNFMKH